MLNDYVRNHMSMAVQTIDHECSLLQSARCMCNQHIHRLVVLDHDRPIGIITSLDLIAAFLATVEE
ncbi:MAG TPA: hypothetical protein DHW22_09515 [Planctomycetaceae bacterium]|nr:hypothetical protein [Planctomycetaceae bacterium]